MVAADLEMVMTDEEIETYRQLADRFLADHEGTIDPFSVVDQFAETVLAVTAQNDRLRGQLSAIGAAVDGYEGNVPPQYDNMDVDWTALIAGLVKGLAERDAALARVEAMEKERDEMQETIGDLNGTVNRLALVVEAAERWRKRYGTTPPSWLGQDDLELVEAIDASHDGKEGA